MIRPARLRHVVPIALATLVTAGCIGGGDDDPSSVSAVIAPAEVTAGATIEVIVEGEGQGSFELEVIDAFATTTLSEPVEDGRAVFTLPDALTELSGLVAFRAAGSLGDPVIGSTRVVPAGVADTIDIVAGPRTIVADGADQTMAIAIAADSFGNPVSDGSPLTFTRVDDGGTTSQFEANVDGGLAAVLIDSRTTAQRIEVFAELDADAASGRVTYNEVPGPAREVVLEPVEETAFVADGRSLLELRTLPISDRFGNQLPDGHLVRVEVDGPDGIGQLTARTIDGIARFDLVARDRPGVVSVVARVSGARSLPVEIEFVAAVSQLPLRVSAQDDRVTVEVGPVLDASGAVVADGTPATISGPANGDPIEVELIRGAATIVFDNIAAADLDSVAVTVLGVSTTEDVQ